VIAASTGSGCQSSAKTARRSDVQVEQAVIELIGGGLRIIGSVPGRP